MSAEPVTCPCCGGSFDETSNLCTFCRGGVHFAGVGLAAKTTSLACPRCGVDSKLHEVEYRGVRVDVCVLCEGTWLDLGELDVMVREARKDATAGSFSPSGRISDATRTGVEEPLNPVYVRCPRCEKLMGRRNWEKRSGVVIDSCLEHGIWLDGGELQRIRVWAAQTPKGPPPPSSHPQDKVTLASHSGSLSSGTGLMSEAPSQWASAGGWLAWLVGRFLGGR